MRNYFPYLLLVGSVISACSTQQPGQKSYYVGQHKFHQLRYGIHEDHSGYPIGGTNQANKNKQQPMYNKDGSSKKFY